MAFMHPYLSETQDRFLVSDEIEEALFCKYNGIGLLVGEYDADEEYEDEHLALEVHEVSKQFGCSRFEIVKKCWGYMTPHGCYTDRSDYYLGDTRVEVAEQILAYHYDGDPEYMDAEELEEMEWLQEIIDHEEKNHE